MGNKKKSCNISLYMSLFVVLVVCFLYSFMVCCTYAMTEQEYVDYLTDAKNFLDNQNINNDLNSYINTSSTLVSGVDRTWARYFADYDGLFICHVGNGKYAIRIYKSNQLTVLAQQNNNLIDFKFKNNVGSTVYAIYPTTNGSFDIRSFQSGNTNVFFDVSGYYFTNQDIYDYNNQTVIFSNDNQIDLDNMVSNSITLLSSSNHKFGFNDKNQCRAYLTGYDISDITFYVDRYINDDWEQFTNSSEYYRLSESDDPYYIYWANMNYFPIGTYRYRAVYDSENQFTSDSFSITNMIIDNNGTYNNGNISIDTGNTVDNIKDYFGSQADTSIVNINDDDIENSLGLERTVNPYQNFVFTIVNGLLDSLLGTSPEYISFKVHSWGQTFKIYVDDIVPNYGTDLRNFLTLISTVVVMIYIIRWITKVVESINTADVDTTLDLIEEKYSDLL